VQERIHHLHTNGLPVNSLGGHTIDLRFPTDHFLILMQSESTIPTCIRQRPLRKRGSL